MYLFLHKSIKFKTLYILLLFIMLIILSLHFKSYFKIDVVDLKKNRIYSNNLVTAVKYYDSYLCFDSVSGIFYTNDKKIDVGKVNVISPYKVSFIYEKINDDKYDIFVYSDKFYKRYEVRIVDIPLISIRTFNDVDDYLISKNNNITLTYNNEIVEQKPISKISFSLIDNNYEKRRLKKNFESINASMYVRGATSLQFSKKSYRIILDNGLSVLGMRKDKDWILDALYTDQSKIRNKFSSDMWNLINNNQSVDNDLSGEFVEVFIDDNYCGLYVLKEKVNKKNLNVSSDGLLAKSIAHVDDYIKNDFMMKDLSNVFVEDGSFLGNFEIKQYSKSSLNSFYSKLGDFYSSEYLFDTIDKTFDLKNFLNYKIFLLLTYGDDNFTKNQYLSMSESDSKILITPWDMDLTWGLFSTYEGEFLSSKKCDSYSDISWIYSVVGNMDEKTLSLLKERYWQLRKDVITMDTINEYLNSYKKLLVESGAAKRDSDRWYEYDVEFEIEQIREWANNRIQFLDEYFK